MKKLLTHKNMLILESCTFIFAIIVIIFASNYSSIYIRMIPLLFLCGTIGNIIFKRPIVTSVYGIAVSMCILYSTKNYTLYQILVLSVFDGINIGLGELFGSNLNNIIKYFRKKRYKNFKEKIK